jgi:hypothetical protein
VARGWESKSIESQVEDAATRGERRGERELSAAERARAHKLNSLTLSRTRVEGELLRCSNERFRAQLIGELKYLEAEIAKLGE